MPDRRTGARGLLRGPTHQLVQWEGEGEVSPPGICISTGCPTTRVLMVQGHSHHGEVRPPVSQLPGSRARIARLEILEHFLLHTVQSREERRDVSSEVGRHGLSDFFFLMDRGEPCLLFLKRILTPKARFPRSWGSHAGGMVSDWI